MKLMSKKIVRQNPANTAVEEDRKLIRDYTTPVAYNVPSCIGVSHHMSFSDTTRHH